MGWAVVPVSGHPGFALDHLVTVMSASGNVLGVSGPRASPQATPAFSTGRGLGALVRGMDGVSPYEPYIERSEEGSRTDLRGGSEKESAWRPTSPPKSTPRAFPPPPREVHFSKFI